MLTQLGGWTFKQRIRIDNLQGQFSIVNTLENAGITFKTVQSGSLIKHALVFHLLH